MIVTIQASAPLLLNLIPIRHSYENGIQTFDTANVSLNPVTFAC